MGIDGRTCVGETRVIQDGWRILSSISVDGADRVDRDGVSVAADGIVWSRDYRCGGFVWEQTAALAIGGSMVGRGDCKSCGGRDLGLPSCAWRSPPSSASRQLGHSDWHLNGSWRVLAPSVRIHLSQSQDSVLKIDPADRDG